MVNLNSILLIDDDPISNFIIRRLLTSVGFKGEIILAKNGLEGMGILKIRNSDKQSFPDLILLDLNMPVMNGIEFLEQLRKEDLCLNMSQITLISNSLHPAEKEALHKLGVEKFLLKPLNPIILKDFLEGMKFYNS